MFFEVPPTPAAYSAPAHTAEISVLTYNVHGLPWPLAQRRGTALREIGAEWPIGSEGASQCGPDPGGFRVIADR